MSNEETSESGSPVYRHGERKDWEYPENTCLHLEEIEAHVGEYIGPVESVFHEILSDKIHLDVLVIPACPKRPYHTLITSGVSDKAMSVPDGMDEFRHAELMINLPPEWPLKDLTWNDENNYWPIRWLKQVGRLPHNFDTWIGWGHTIPNGDPPEPIANTEFTGVLVELPVWEDKEFFQLRTESGVVICFYHMIPLYQDELDLKLKKGVEKLESLFDKNDVGKVLDVSRVNVAKRRRWFW